MLRSIRLPFLLILVLMLLCDSCSTKNKIENEKQTIAKSIDSIHAEIVILMKKFEREIDSSFSENDSLVVKFRTSEASKRGLPCIDDLKNPFEYANSEMFSELLMDNIRANQDYVTLCFANFRVFCIENKSIVPKKYSAPLLFNQNVKLKYNDLINESFYNMRELAVKYEILCRAENKR
jgi:hypothetical protein